MIPVRVYVENFLCHARQEFVFDGHPVWLLHGPNGVGKSAVFDAMVYALFDESDRREGCGTRVADLVRYGASSMRVEFDFEYRGRRYRVWRTRSRGGQPRQGVGEFVNGEPAPRPVRDVNGSRELSAWVRATLGLTYDAFVSAVLLRQGAAERLIDADRDARRNLFRGIIDLEPYLRLHTAVTDARAEASGEVRRLRAAILQQREVTDDELTTAAATVQQAAHAVEDARALAAAAQARLTAARVWDALEANRQAVLGELAAARERSGRAAALEATVRRLTDLRCVVPAIARVAEARAAVTSGEAARIRLDERLAEAVERHVEHTAAAQRERERAASCRGRTSGLRTDIATAAARRDRLAEQIRQAEQAAALHQQLHHTQAVLTRTPVDLDEQLARAEVLLLESQEARDAFPHLAALAAHRTSHNRAAADAREAAEAEAALGSALDRLRAEAAELALQAATAAARAEEARQSAALAADHHARCRERLERFRAVVGSNTCPECGQSVDAAHAERERANLEGAVRGTDERAAECRDAASEATQEAERARQAALESETERARTEAARVEAAGRRNQAEAQVHASRAGFATALGELPPSVAGRVAQVDAAGFPSDADAHAARELGRQVGPRTRDRDELRQLSQDRREALRALDTLTQAIQAVGAPPDVTAARNELAACTAEIARLEAECEAADGAARAAEAAERGHTEGAAAETAEVNRLSGESGAAREAEQNARRRLTAALAELPAGACEADVEVLRSDLSDLEASGAERELAALAEDRALQARRERNLADLEDQIAERVPPDARRPSAEVASELAQADEGAAAAERVRDAAGRRLADLTGHRERRAEMQAALAASDRDHALRDRLAGYLGQEGIQLDMVRQAEGRIIELANDTLGRVSRGELRLEPPDPASTQALDLSVRRAGTPEPIPVGNLSGGQRCRVAVSLALAVCRFACGEAQPLESVVIDEAFANLDRDGRMAMIDVIRDGEVAGGVLRRIIVVSHHEDLSAAIPNGYRLENNGGMTTVTRL